MCHHSIILYSMTLFLLFHICAVGGVPPNWCELVKKSQESLLTDIDFDKASNFHLDEVDEAISEFSTATPTDIVTNNIKTIGSAENAVRLDSRVSIDKRITKPVSPDKSPFIVPQSPTLDSLSLRRSPRIAAQKTKT